MKAEISLSNLWCNPSLMNFFMRTQARNTLEELEGQSEDTDELFGAIENYYDDLDDLEEDLYSMTPKEFAETIGVEFEEEEEEEDDEDDEEEDYCDEDL